MKKSLIALAALGAISAASAQSSLNLYGIADVWVGSQKTNGAASETKMGSGGLAGSRIGFKGTEDLGGGLKANFTLEQSVDLTDGTATGFDRQAWVGLSGGFGALQLGNAYTAMDDIWGAANSGFDSALSATSTVWVGYNSNPGSNIKYTSPSFAGFNAAVSTNLDGKGSDARVISAQLNYNNGPIYAGLGYQSDKQKTAGVNTRHLLANGSYDLGAAKLMASYARVLRSPDAFTPPMPNSGRTDQFQVGVDVPMGAVTLSAGYATAKDSAGGATVDKRNGFSLAAGYTLSKRSTVYGGLRASDSDASGKSNLYAIGLNHKF